jgi:hypothetical protein
MSITQLTLVAQDWTIQIVFFTYLGLRINSIALDREGSLEASRDYFDMSHFVLAFNSIVLWVRMLDYLSFSAELGPAVRIMVSPEVGGGVRGANSLTTCTHTRRG